VLQLAQIVHDIEVNFWARPEDVRSDVVEEGFRWLQQRYARTSVPPTCYIAFFDNVYKMLQQEEHYHDPEELLPYKSCEKGDLSTPSLDDNYVKEMPVNELLTAISQGKKVTFVDARESAEFDQNHIPKAVNLQIRDVNGQTVSQFLGSDIVVAYCVKDFRGYELAKLLKLNGIDNAVILNPYGIKGWKKSGLPIYEKNKVDEVTAFNELKKCASSPDICLGSMNDG
jgi:rhodanese-related sulfurtransferase